LLAVLGGEPVHDETSRAKTTATAGVRVRMAEDIQRSPRRARIGRRLAA
jgi:hypothetical protein